MVPEPRSKYALTFFLLSTVLLAVAGGLSKLLIELLPINVELGSNQIPAAFAISTCLLFCGSGCMYGAVESVRRERQRPFRRWLKAAMVSGVSFVAVQTYALSSLFRQQNPEDVETGATAFVALFAAMHGMHFVIALLFLTFVTVQAFADRYDHEYFFGIFICSWFWHALVIVWLAILFVMLVARFYA